MIPLPVGTDAPRAGPIVGMLHPNSSETGFDYFTGVSWESLTLNQISAIIDTTSKNIQDDINATNY